MPGADQLGFIIGIVAYVTVAIAIGVHCHANLREDSSDSFGTVAMMWLLAIIWPLPIVLTALWGLGRKWTT